MPNPETTTMLVLPALGDHVDEVTITRWLKNAGEHFEHDEPLLEVSTDKVETEIPATGAGTLLEILTPENEVVQIGAALAVLSGSEVADPVPAQTRAIPVPVPVPADPPPSVAVEPATIPTVQRLSRVRQTIARRMLESLQTSAQLTTVVEVDVTTIAGLRAQEKEDFHRRTGVKLSFLPFFVAAAVETLAEHPVLNSSLDADCTEITYHADVHLGMAVDSDKGLMVPVLRDAAALSLVQLAQGIAAVAERVRLGTIRPDDLAGGTFTITNTGSRGALFDTPIINQPQSAILGVGAVVDRVVPIRSEVPALEIGVRSMAYLSLSYDHRTVDGADAARYLTAVKRRLERGFTADDLR
ncbi:2-oxo acid dehydrogenase subunit E2 [Arthrobacter sp. SLBN-53]|uniref:2-oxo acid dehydrogenase subunit E2 n=1 Tax=Arthrobacter sp. SLBN-53 TaxID=2768412 RepID=UPI00114EE3BF|nr:2-oxo acid dehydrogenase subunit E2 [Arthrobacter sp. SLBN-53]TQK28629.1 2-oxoglutarate dehydrogenase E2 component (dihydrolipoamide succinyltransferase) [Arthrobacter sp. SLBN-53]